MCRKIYQQAALGVHKIMPNSTEDAFDFQAFLQSDKLADRRHDAKFRAIITSMTGCLSVVSSAVSYGTSCVHTKASYQHISD